MVLDDDLRSMMQRLQEALAYKIKWTWVKVIHLQVKGKWKVETKLNNFFDRKAEKARLLKHEGEVDPFFLYQKCGITWAGRRIHGCPREVITFVYHATNL